MKGLQAWLKMELREVRRDKKRQGDTKDEQICLNIMRGQHKGRVMDLDQTCGVLSSADTKKERSRLEPPSQVFGRRKPQASRECFHGVSWRDIDRESDDLVNHIGCVFRYFIVDVVDLVSTPEVAVQP
ncbi:hypothetical protein DY000_02033960 [Brassica cretica]|uniref:Uncharacterized protein n=1 Tax=Brassica cretica TaxID=69181 RepID=A0ABQ7DRQ5_BRACR|nr:hypothetical protein DY000_02033960 [Brassica cretica]